MEDPTVPKPQEQFAHDGPFRGTPPEQSPGGPWWHQPVWLVAGAFIALLLGVVLGRAMAPEKVLTKTVTEEVEVTPQVCLDAFDAVAESAGVQADMWDITSDFLIAASEFDIDTMDSLSADMESLQVDFEATLDRSIEPIQDCRALAA